MPTYRYGTPTFRGGALEIGAATKEFFTSETGATAVGVVAGMAAGEWIGAKIATSFNITEGWGKVAVFGVAKGLTGFIFYLIGKRTHGLINVALNGAAVGALASFIADILAKFTGTFASQMSAGSYAGSYVPPAENIPAYAGETVLKPGVT